MSRRRIVATPEELFDGVEEYREHCADTGEPMTQTGMAMWLGFKSRQSFYDYAKRPEFEEAVKWARLVVENAYEQRLTTLRNPGGAIFALKNQGWSDRQQLEHMGEDGGPIHVEVTRRIVRPDEG